MAEYTQTTTYDASMQDLIRMWNNTTTKRFIEQFNALIDAELTLVDAGVVAYTFTLATWNKSVAGILQGLNNDTSRQCFKKFCDLLATDFVDIAANGMSYTRDITVRGARECFYSCPNSINRELLHEMIALVIIELDLIVAAS